MPSLTPVICDQCHGMQLSNKMPNCQHFIKICCREQFSKPVSMPNAQCMPTYLSYNVLKSCKLLFIGSNQFHSHMQQTLNLARHSHCNNLIFSRDHQSKQMQQLYQELWQKALLMFWAKKAPQISAHCGKDLKIHNKSMISTACNKVRSTCC